MSLLSLLLACTGPESASGDSVALVAAPDVVALRVTPDDVFLTTGPTGGTPTNFFAEATFEDGSVGPLSDVAWSLSNSVTGAIDSRGTFTPAAGTGGVTYVTARFAGVEDSSRVTVVYTDEIVNEGADPTLFSGEAVADDTLWTYPADGVNFPRNTPGITFQWADRGNQTARLRFTSGVTDVTVYATGTSWTADEALWQQIAASNAGGQVSVSLAVAAGGVVYAEAPLLLNVNRMDGAGTVYYWSISVQGTVRIPYAGVAETFLVDPGGECLGCHAIGAGKIATTLRARDPTVPLTIGVSALSDLSTLLSTDAGLLGDFKAWSPDGAWLVVAWNGSLVLYDGVSFQEIAEIPTDGYATQPDWSPDGSQLAFVRAGSFTADTEFTDGAIAVMDWLGNGQFGPPTVLYDPDEPTNAYYPAWSPDSAWIAFNTSTGDSYDDADATLMVLPRGGGTAVALSAANQETGLTNSYPRWGPLPDDDVLWIAFSSVRPYGNNPASYHQVWVAGFDPARAAAGVDPSWPAFWLPGQDLATSNHVPVWYDE